MLKGDEDEYNISASSEEGLPKAKKIAKRKTVKPTASQKGGCASCASIHVMIGIEGMCGCVCILLCTDTLQA